GWLRQALDEIRIALTIDPDDASTQKRRDGLLARTEKEVAALMERARTSPAEARRFLLAALALDPTSAAALEGLRGGAPVPRGIRHRVRPGDTASDLALLYYCDRSRSENVEEANGLPTGARLPVGRDILIPKIAGLSLRPDC